MNRELHIKQMHKLDGMLKELDTVVLYPPLMWLYTWSEIDDFIRNNSDYVTLVSREDIFMALVETEEVFALSQGSEQHYNDVLDWLLNEGLIKDIEGESDGDYELGGEN